MRGDKLLHDEKNGKSKYGQKGRALPEYSIREAMGQMSPKPHAPEPDLSPPAIFNDRGEMVNSIGRFFKDIMYAFWNIIDIQNPPEVWRRYAEIIGGEARNGTFGLNISLEEQGSQIHHISYPEVATL